ncbi:SDR family oxidoreductase [Achromobacter denitrificans]|uniref:SDR family oxidoreductase n=1 Tax=Achromobacter denitrificans TaxID=32002 RepID=A0A427WUB8_ACHDE|nr:MULTISPECIES: SDR family oxidoreductase [Achromobacter]ASC68854.1 3-hydroxyacyl-CoA dehydrogenase [Achromobacter denitrificans]MBV2161643.1 SDR family oxidoreductase [Achromobacter denitrificans]MDF3850748.1 SDR family oxidoreductase [Achromobacter denitrificans]MDF3858828.1 SDR family oxidoreductase [Achromobacter denitrificans]MDF3939762.1 SDR family oxidoreductase [Achromobacter denitrificans]
MLEGKVVVVTGAANGIGRAAAVALAAQGARVVVNDLNVSLDGTSASQSTASQVVEEIRAAGGTAIANGDSVAEYASAKRIIEAAADTYGRVDAVVNNAGIVRDKMFHRLTPEDFDAVVKVHLYGCFNLSHAAAGHFREQGGGSLINMTSNSAVIGNRGQANYCAAKLGIVGLSKAMALDMAAFNVRSNCIAPLAWSRMTETIPAKTEEQARHVEKIRRMGPETIAPLICYLASDASSEVSGQVFAIRLNEIFLMSQSRPVRSVHRSDGWTAQSIAEHGMAALRASFMPLDTSAQVFAWDPV